MKKAILLLPFVFLLSSCGVKYTPAVNTTDITQIDFQKDLERSEKNCAYRILGYLPLIGSSYSAIEVAKEAGFRKVSAVDYQSDNFVILKRTCVVIYGK